MLSYYIRVYPIISDNKGYPIIYEFIVITPKPSQATATQPKSNPKQLGCGFDMKIGLHHPTTTHHPTGTLISALEQYRAIFSSAILTNHPRLS